MKTYLVGPPGGGKTQRLTERLAELISAGTRPDRILVVVPQRAQTERYRAALARVRGSSPGMGARGEPQITTFTGLVQQHVSLFFPLMAGQAGFEQPGREPIFLNIESTQYFLNRVVEPRKADFDELKLSRPRLLGQVLDSMTKAAIVGFPLSELAERLGSAWTGAPERLRAYAAMQEAALAFRNFCLQHSLLDFSLVMETYAQHLLPSSSYRDYIVAKHRHVIADNIEEGVPVLHDFLRLLLNTCDSAVLAEDDPGGYRIFLGADGASARRLRSQCDEVIEAASLRRALSAEMDSTSEVESISASRNESATQHLAQFLAWPEAKPNSSLIREALGTDLTSQMYWQGMVREVASTIRDLISEGAKPNEIVVISPFVEDVLLFELRDQFQDMQIGVRPLRPSRPLSDHPITRAMLAVTKLAYPEWEMVVSEDELARALSMCVTGLDVPRAQLLAKAAQRISVRELPVLEDQKVLNRVGMRFREPYLHLQRWLSEVRNSPTLKQEPLDVFWQRLLSHVLVAEGFVLYVDSQQWTGRGAGETRGGREARDLAVACDKLIRSARAFRETLTEVREGSDVSREYVRMVGMGLMAAQSVNERAADEQAAFRPDPNAILLAPAYAYLTNDFQGLYRRYQFWLNVNSLDWYRRIVQPLTHPYVLSRNWLPQTSPLASDAPPLLEGEGSRKWTDLDEHREQEATLRRLVSGLAYRCTGKVFIASSQINLRGEEESGPLQKLIRKAIASRSVVGVETSAG